MAGGASKFPHPSLVNSAEILEVIPIVVAISALLSIGGPVEEAPFDFDRTLRIDYVRTGDAERAGFALDRTGIEGPWPGPRTRLIDDMNLGHYRFEVLLPDGGPVLFSRGFSSVFNEWQTTAEAKTGVPRVFHETVRLPFPRTPVTVRWLERNAQGAFETVIAVVPIDPDSRSLVPVGVRREVQVTPIVENGPPADHLDILIVGDGFSDAEAERFVSRVSELTESLLSQPPYADYRDRINVRAVRPTRDGSGIDHPRRGQFVDNWVGSSFNTFNLERYALTLENRALRDVAGQAPYDTLLVMLNTDRYGGGGILGQYTCFSSDNEFTEFLVIHEMGHSFAGLGDEYFDSTVAYEDFHAPGVEPWEPNITALLDPENLKWAEDLSKGVPIPTPADDPAFDDSVGAFEGAGYVEKGLYRPMKSCVMKDRGRMSFCPVCERAIIERLRFFFDEDA